MPVALPPRREQHILMAKKNAGNMGLPGRRAPLRGEGPSIAADRAKRRKGGDEKPTPGEDIVKLRHCDWQDNHIRWHWLMDSYEGGQRYRDAAYGPDRRGVPLRNLVRHKREYPDALDAGNPDQGFAAFMGPATTGTAAADYGPFPGSTGADPTATAQDDDYEYRRARTPVPEFLAEVIDHELAKIYDQAIDRKGPDELVRFWLDVNGAGVPMGDWMRDDVAPLARALGTLDVCFDRPALPEGTPIRTRRDEEDWGLDTCIASYILPENMVWWRNDPAGNYLECLVREYDSTSTEGRDPDPSQPDGRAQESVRFRHWTPTTVTLYRHDGEVIEATRDHGYPFVPIRRVLGGRRRHRTPMVGKPAHEEIAELQREYYNRNSELILSDTLQAAPSLSGPEDYCKPDQSLSVGPQYILPKKKNGDHSYEGWEYVSPPKDPARELRENLHDVEDRKDRRAGLTKPAGVTGTTGGTVSQSGYSKMFDAERGCELLSDGSKAFARIERQLSEFALMCIRRRVITPADRAAIKIVYPSRFQLRTAESILDMLSKVVPILTLEEQMSEGPTAGTPADQAGGNPATAAQPPPGIAAATPRRFALPTLLAGLFNQFSSAIFVGNPDVPAQVSEEAKVFFRLHILESLGTSDDTESMRGRGSEEQAAGTSRTGVSGATLVSGGMTAIP